MFSDCSSLISVAIPDSVIRIGEDAFNDCDSLIYNIKGGLKYLGNSNNPYLYLAGVEDKKITTVAIDNNCKIIGAYTFSGCNLLINIILPNSVTTINEGAFYSCSSLTSIEIGDNVRNIGSFAICGSFKLTSIKYRGTEEQWNSIIKENDWDYNTGNYTVSYDYT